MIEYDTFQNRLNKFSYICMKNHGWITCKTWYNSIKEDIIPLYLISMNGYKIPQNLITLGCKLWVIYSMNSEVGTLCKHLFMTFDKL